MDSVIVESYDGGKIGLFVKKSMTRRGIGILTEEQLTAMGNDEFRGKGIRNL